MASRWLTLDNFRTIADSTQPKETWTIPGRAGDVARNGREARVSRVAPDISAGHDRDRVSVTLVFAHENGTGLEAPVPSRLAPRARPSRNLAVFASTPPWACSWICQQINRAMRSLVKAIGGDNLNVVRHRARSSSRPSNRMRSISASNVSRSVDRRVMPPTPPCAPTCLCAAPREPWQRSDRCAPRRSSRRRGSGRASCAPHRPRSRGPNAAANRSLS